MIFLEVIPVDEVHSVMGLAGRNPHRHAIAQELVGAKACLVETDASDIGGRQQPLNSGRNMRLRITSLQEVQTKQVSFDAAVVRALMPVAKIFITKPIGPNLVGEQGNDAVLR